MYEEIPCRFAGIRPDRTTLDIIAIAIQLLTSSQLADTLYPYCSSPCHCYSQIFGHRAEFTTFSTGRFVLCAQGVEAPHFALFGLVRLVTKSGLPRRLDFHIDERVAQSAYYLFQDYDYGDAWWSWNDSCT
jgi:hypothetical protein